MRNLSLVFLFFLVPHVGLSQNLTEEDYVGVFSEINSNPEGGGTLVVFPDNTYVLVYFGGYQKGKWEIIDEKLRLENDIEPKFALYARKLESLGQQTKIDLSIDSYNQASISLNPKVSNNLKSVFNQNPNCFSSPYFIMQNTPLNHLQAAEFLEEDIHASKKKKHKTDIFNFKNLDGFNDFILINLPSEYTTAAVMHATYHNDLLSFDRGLGEMRKRPLSSIDAEELEYLKNLGSENILPEVLEYGNEFFPYVENETSEAYMPFQRIVPFQVSSGKDVTIEKGSWFIATCEED